MGINILLFISFLCGVCHNSKVEGIDIKDLNEELKTPQKISKIFENSKFFESFTDDPLDKVEQTRDAFTNIQKTKSIIDKDYSYLSASNASTYIDGLSSSLSSLKKQANFIAHFFYESYSYDSYAYATANPEQTIINFGISALALIPGQIFNIIKEVYNLSAKDDAEKLLIVESYLILQKYIFQIGYKFTNLYTKQLQNDTSFISNMLASLNNLLAILVERADQYVTDVNKLTIADSWKLYCSTFNKIENELIKINYKNKSIETENDNITMILRQDLDKYVVNIFAYGNGISLDILDTCNIYVAELPKVFETIQNYTEVIYNVSSTNPICDKFSSTIVHFLSLNKKIQERLVVLITSFVFSKNISQEEIQLKEILDSLIYDVISFVDFEQYQSPMNPETIASLLTITEYTLNIVYQAFVATDNNIEPALLDTRSLLQTITKLNSRLTNEIMQSATSFAITLSPFKAALTKSISRTTKQYDEHIDISLDSVSNFVKGIVGDVKKISTTIFKNNSMQPFNKKELDIAFTYPEMILEKLFSSLAEDCNIDNYASDLIAQLSNYMRIAVFNFNVIKNFEIAITKYVNFALKNITNFTVNFLDKSASKTFSLKESMTSIILLAKCLLQIVHVVTHRLEELVLSINLQKSEIVSAINVILSEALTDFSYETQTIVDATDKSSSTEFFELLNEAKVNFDAIRVKYETDVAKLNVNAYFKMTANEVSNAFNVGATNINSISVTNDESYESITRVYKELLNSILVEFSLIFNTIHKLLINKTNNFNFISHCFNTISEASIVQHILDVIIRADIAQMDIETILLDFAKFIYTLYFKEKFTDIQFNDLYLIATVKVNLINIIAIVVVKINNFKSIINQSNKIVYAVSAALYSLATNVNNTVFNNINGTEHLGNIVQPQLKTYVSDILKRLKKSQTHVTIQDEFQIAYDKL